MSVNHKETLLDNITSFEGKAKSILHFIFTIVTFSNVTSSAIYHQVAKL